MTLRSAGFVTEPITGPRSFGSRRPHRIGKRAVAVFGSGCEVSRIWVERFGDVIVNTHARTERAPPDRCPRSPNPCDALESAAIRRLRQRLRRAQEQGSEPAHRALRAAAQPVVAAPARRPVD